MIRSSVDLPEPLGPSSAVSEPVSTSTETSSSAEVAEALRDVADRVDIRRLPPSASSSVISTRHDRSAITASTSEMPYAPGRSKFS